MPAASSAGGPIFTTPTTRPTIVNGRSLPILPQSAEDRQKEMTPAKPEPEPRNEFQEFVAGAVGKWLPLYGYNLFSSSPSTFAPVDRIPVTPDYVLGPGDEIEIRAWGQVDIDYRAVVERNGTIYIPQIGTLTVGGLRYQDLHGYLRSAISRVFRNFELSVSLGQLRSIQIFVVGQARRPGAYTVSSLSTLVNALFSTGGPSTKGSMRHIQVKRGDRLVTEFDLYDLLQKGDKSKDVRLLPGDVIYIPPAGDLVAISGSVNQPAIFELKPGTSLNDLIELAGGLSTVAAGQKARVERIEERRVRKVDEFALDQNGLARTMQNGDVIHIYALSPRFDNAITLRGSVATPGRFPWREGMRVRDVIPDRESLIVRDYWQRLNMASLLSTTEDARSRIEGLRTAPPADEVRPRSDGASPARTEEPPRLRTDDPRALGALAQTQQQSQQGRSEDARASAEALMRGRIEDIRTSVDRRTRIDEDLFRADVKQRFDEINWDYAVVERLNTSDLTTVLIPFNLARAVLEGDPSQNIALRPGDVITIFSKADIAVPFAKQTKFVRLEGEIRTPGLYQAMPGETLRQLVARVGGFTPSAYLYGSEFTRETVRQQQQKRLDEAIDRLAQEIERNAVTRARASTDPAENVAAEIDGQRRLLARLQQIKASGRIVLEVVPGRNEMRDLPEVQLEDGDRFLVPPRPSTVGVIGSVYNQNTFLYANSKRVSDYLSQAGGLTRDADKGRTYVVRADGTVTGRAQSSFFNILPSESLNPGDTIVVPENLDRFILSKQLRDWTQIFYQFALGVAGLKVLRGF